MRRGLFLIIFFAVAYAPVSHALRCGNKIISEGDSSSKVLTLCGDPTHIDTRTLYRTRQIALPAPGNTGYALNHQPAYAIETITEQITVEGWEYTFGPNRLNQQIWFQNKRVIDIDSLSYGD